MTSSLTRSDLATSLEIIEVKPGLKFSKQVLIDLLPDTRTALFFGKVYELDYAQLSNLLRIVCKSDVAQALLSEGGEHSSDLQDYVVDMLDFVANVQAGDVSFAPDVPKGEFLPEVWASMEIEVAKSIKDVAAKLESVVGLMPGKQGSMVFQSMAVLNAKRPIIGDYKARIQHAPQKENLVILDDSGSVNRSTVERIVADVVSMSYMANAHFALVSNTCRYWQPGTYGVDEILAATEIGGTQYEQLEPLFDRDWGVVVTIADYDSSYSAKDVLSRCTGRIDQVLDISLVGRPTFLAECVGQLADEVRPLLVGNSDRVLR